ncbi:MAG: redoxin domain-containing protein, partial [Caulobacteraceae bacterium]
STGAAGAWFAMDQAVAADAHQTVGRIDNFRLPSADLQSYELYRMKDAAAIVVLTQQNGCEASRASAAVLQRLKARYGGQGVEFLMLNSNLKDDREAVVAEQAKLGGGDIPVLMDANQLVGEGLNVSKAGEVIVIDPKTFQVAYRGALDESTGAAVLDGVIAGKPTSVKAKAPTGCPIILSQRGRQTDFAKISYATQIAPIIEEKCVSCHQKGSIGPMEFTSYEKVKGFAPMIREVVRTNRMPPWQAEPGIGHFKNDKSLSPEQIKTLVHWIEAGAPRGNGADPLSLTQHVAQEWPLGKPDLVLDLPSYAVPATGIVDYQHPWTANPQTEGRWIRASTIKPGSRQAVHHILTGYMNDVPKTASTSEAGWGSSVGTYAVGAESDINPSDVGVYFPPGGAIGFQNHYTPYGKA